MNRIFLILSMIVLPFWTYASTNDDLLKSKGTDQAVIASLVPSPGQKEVSRYTKIEAAFSVPLDPSSVQKNNIKLTWLSSKSNDHIDGTIAYDSAAQKVIYAPKKILEPGMYEVEIKSLKADKAHKSTQIKEIKYRFIVVKELLKSITITPNPIDTKEGTTVQLQAIGHYDNGMDKNLTTKVAWTIDNNATALVNATGMLTALKEGSAVLKASMDTVEENAIVTVYKEISGHRLPPEPDRALNNSTLLGIDSNNNGVRDDVERWIYKRYNTYYPCEQGIEKVVIDGQEMLLLQGRELSTNFKTTCSDSPVAYHPIIREIAMQFGRAAQIVIQEPENAASNVKYMHAAVDCNSYFEYFANYRNDPLLIDHTVFNEEFKSIQFNNVRRVRAFAEYNMALSGGVYGTGSIDEKRKSCDFNVTILLEGK